MGITSTEPEGLQWQPKMCEHPHHIEASGGPVSNTIESLIAA
jgi:hypothetical protein